MSKGCYIIAAGKEATADGSVLLARSCDSHGDHAEQVLVIPRKKHNSDESLIFDLEAFPGKFVKLPQVSETYGYITMMGIVERRDACNSVTSGGINEFQVCSGASAGGPLNEKAERVCPRINTTLGDRRMNLVLERCKTAREGVKLIAELTEKYGARTDTYVIADPNEVWLYEEYRGRLWLAVRVPDDSFFVYANILRVDKLDLSDTANYMGSKDIISFAVDNDLYDPETREPFNPSLVYGERFGKKRYGIEALEYDRRRIWRGISLIAPSTKLDPEESTINYPLFLKPDKKLTPKDLISVLTDHYQGTKYDPYESNKHKYRPAGAMLSSEEGKKHGVIVNYLAEPSFQINENREYQLAPAWSLNRIIGTPRAVTTFCAQLRSWMPNYVGGLMWGGLAEAACSGHIPWYCGITKTPKPYTTGTMKERSDDAIAPFKGSIYDERSAYWNFRVISNLVNLFYTATKDEVIPVWRAWEDELYRIQPFIEKAALELDKNDPKLAKEFLTFYSNSKAVEALKITKNMITRLYTIIAHYNGSI